MARPAYLRPPWWLRNIANRLSPLFGRDKVALLEVRGRRSGRIRTTPVVVLNHDHQRYLVTPYGNAEWVRNLRAAGTGRLRQHGRTETFSAVEVPVDQRLPLLNAYRREYGMMPTVARSFEQLPDPVDHPTFRITQAQASRDRAS